MDNQKIKDLLYLEMLIVNRIHNEIDELLRDKETDNQKFKESIMYQIDDIIMK